MRKFWAQMEPHIKRLYPEARRIEWTHNVVRGGDRAGDQPRALGPHLDFYQDDATRLEFHKDKPPLSPGCSKKLQKIHMAQRMMHYIPINTAFQLGASSPRQRRTT